MDRPSVPTPTRSTERPLAWLAAIVPVAVFAVFAYVAFDEDMTLGSAGRAGVAIVITQVVPGVLVWRALRPRHGWWIEDLLMGFAIGSVIGLFSQIPAGLLGLWWLPLLVAGLIAGILLATPLTRARIVGRQSSPLPWWWYPGAALPALVALQPFIAYTRAVPMTWASGTRSPHVDAPLHLALAAQLEHRGPTTFPWVESEPLAYHWFSHAWTAEVAGVSGAELDQVLFRVMPAMLPVVIALTVAIAAVRLTGLAWTGVVASLITMAGSDLNVFGHLTPGLPVAPLSPSLGMAAPMMIALVVVLAMRWRGELPSWSLLLTVVLAVGAAGTKGSTLPLVVAGLGLALVGVLLFDRERWRMVGVDLVVALACLAFAFATVFQGSGAGLDVDFSGAAAATPGALWFGGVSSAASKVFVLVLAVAAVLSRGIGIVLALLTARGRRDPLTWLLLGGGLAGAFAVGVFAHPGSSQYYFARTAGPILALGSVIGLAAAMPELRRTRPALLVGALVCGPLIALGPVLAFGGTLPRGDTTRCVVMLLLGGAVLAALVAVVLVVADGGRRTATALGVVALLAAGLAVMGNVVVRTDIARHAPPVLPDAPFGVSREQVDAARWLRANTGIDEMVMTNRHCNRPVPPDQCDNRRFVIAAYSERQVLLEGWTPAPKAQEIAPGRASITVDYWYPDLLALNDRFIAAPVEADRDDLWERGVRWVFVDHSRPYADTLEPLATLRYQNSGVDVYELVPPG